MPDVKKLITGFLILAAGASSSAWIISNISNNPAAASQTAVATSTPLLGGNAFVPLPPTTDDLTDLNVSSTGSDDPNNITDNLADAYANDIAIANPNGFQMDSTGDAQVTQPDPATVTATLGAEPGLAAMTMPDWDSEVAALQNQMETVPDSTSSILAYLTAFNKINTQGLVSSGLASTTNDPNADPTAVLPVAGTSISTMIAQANDLSVPMSMIGLQKAFLKILVYEKNDYLLASNASDDPAKTAIMLQYEQTNYAQAVTDFTNQAQTVRATFALNNSKQGQGMLAEVINKVLFINQADAIFGLGDVVTDPIEDALINLGVSAQVASMWADYFAGLAQDMVIQIAKNVIMAQVQQHVIKWIQGSGAPRFIQNWGTTIANAYTAQALNMLNQQMACIGPVQSGNLKILLATPQVGAQNSCANVFNSFLNSPNFKQLSTHFTNFNDYFQLYQPGGNMWSSLITIQNTAMRAGSNGQTAAQAQALAGQGWTGSQQCPDGSNPNGVSYKCDPGDSLTGGNMCLNIGGGTYPASLQANGGICATGNNNKNPVITMPSIVSGQMLSQGIGSSPKLIAAANSVAGLINAIASSLLTSIAQEVVGAVTKDVNGVLSGGPGNSGGLLSISPSSTITTTSVPPSPVQCATPQISASLDATTQLATVNLLAEGGAIDVNAQANGGSTGQPTYTWSAPGSISGTGGTGAAMPFVVTYNTPGTYTATVTASTDGSTATCTVTITATPTSTLPITPSSTP